MIVRLFALLLAVGMLVISGTSAAELGTPAATTIVDDADDLSEITVIESPAVLSDQSGAQSGPPALDHAPGRSPEVIIFRPPRPAAFV